MRHLIERQYLAISMVGNEAGGRALQARLPDFCQTELLPALERVLDRHAPPDRHLTIERLELDVGILQGLQPDRQWVEAIARALETALSERTAIGTIGRPQAAEVTISEREHTERAFLHFLLTGTLPWAFRLAREQPLEAALRAVWQADGRPALSGGTFRNELLAALQQSVVRQRLVLQCSEELRWELLRLLSPADARIMRALQLRLETGRQLPDYGQLWPRIWAIAFDLIARGQPLKAGILLARLRGASPTSLPPALVAWLQARWPAAGSNASTSTDEEPDEPGGDQPDEVLVPERAAAVGADGQVYYIDNAGLVLLHPFLPRLFEGLGIARAGRLLSPERAIHLLHYLVTGLDHAPEYELMLPKLLCAWPLSKPIALDGQLDESDREEAEALLRAVIGHWTALGHATPDGLRGNFLYRPARLWQQEDGDWQLLVESRTYDVVIDQLPWGIGLIQLPWMPTSLHTHWR